MSQSEIPQCLTKERIRDFLHLTYVYTLGGMADNFHDMSNDERRDVAASYTDFVDVVRLLAAQYGIDLAELDIKLDELVFRVDED